jgi:hypothetical protein
MKQDWSTDPTWDWTTNGLAAGNYLVSVWVRALGSGVSSFEAQNVTPYVLSP